MRKTGIVAASCTVVLIILIAIVWYHGSALQSRKPVVFPFHNVLYPYVEFRPPSNATWRSDGPSPSSRTGEFAVEYTNADSLRIPSKSYELSHSKPSEQVRIAVVGGSTVRIGTRFESSLPGAMKRVLTNRHPAQDIEVLNAGIISAVSRQELVFLLTTLVDYDPDILIVYDGINDSGQMLYYESRPNFPYNYGIIEEAWHKYVGNRKDPLWRLLVSRIVGFTRKWRQEPSEGSILRKVAPSRLIGDAELRQLYAKAHADNWEKIRRVCSAFQIEPAFVLQPTSLYALFQDSEGREIVGSNSTDALYANYLVYEEFRKNTETLLRQHPGLRVLDLSTLLPFEAFFDGAHVYDDVNDVIAEKLADLIDDEVTELGEKRRIH